MNYLSLIVTLLPQIIQLVKLAESLFPNAGNGPGKLDFVLSAIEATLNHVPEVQANVSTIVSAVRPIVGVIVSTFNALGLFKGSKALTTAESFAGTSKETQGPASDNRAPWQA